MNHLLRNFIDLYDAVLDTYWDKRFGIQTTKIVEVKDLLPDKIDHLKHAKKYQAVRTRVLRKGLRYFKQYEDSQKFRFIDLGSGKGRTLIWSKKYQFKEYLGIEFSKHLVNLSQKNQPDTSFGTFVCKDVLDIKIKDEPTVFFMFNPFDGKVTRKFLEKIEDWRSPVYFIYINPILDFVFDMNTGYRLIHQYNEINPNNRIHIYKRLTSDSF